MLELVAVELYSNASVRVTTFRTVLAAPREGSGSGENQGLLGRCSPQRVL